MKGKRKLANLAEYLDTARLEANRMVHLLEVAQAEGPPRLSAQEVDSLLEGIQQAEDALGAAQRLLTRG